MDTSDRKRLVVGILLVSVVEREGSRLIQLTYGMGGGIIALGMLVLGIALIRRSGRAGDG